MVSVKFHFDKEMQVSGKVTLPAGTTGIFEWQDRQVELKAGTTTL
jgi:hypothetical protein